MMPDQVVTFAAVFAALYAGHHVGDHWIQTHGQALSKAAPGWSGRRACAAHVATLTATKAATVAVTAVVLALPLSVLAVAVALTVDAVSHYVADRRTPLARLAAVLPVLRKGEFWRLGDGAAAPTGTGAYALDQSWHIGWLWIAALIVGGWS